MLIRHAYGANWQTTGCTGLGKLCIEAAKGPSWAPGVAETDLTALFRNFLRLNMEIVPQLLFKGRHVYLARRFFPPSYQTDLNDIKGAVYPYPVEFPKTITREAIRAYISRVNASKAPGPDAISNRALKTLKEHLIDVFEKIFQSMPRLKRITQSIFEKLQP